MVLPLEGRYCPDRRLSPRRSPNSAPRRSRGHSRAPRARIAGEALCLPSLNGHTAAAAIDGLDTGRRGGPEPDAITLEAFGREIPEA